MAPDGRLYGLFKDPNVYGAYLVPAALFAAAQLVARRSRNNLLWLSVIAACLGAVFLSFSRGAWANLVVAVGLFFVLFTFADGLSKVWWRTAILIPPLLIGLAVGGTSCSAYRRSPRCSRCGLACRATTLCGSPSSGRP